MKREESTNATLGVVENRMRTVDFEPVNDVERCGRNGPVERLMDLEEEGNVEERTKKMIRLKMEYELSIIDAM